MAEFVSTGKGMKLVETNKASGVPFTQGAFIIEDSGNAYYDPTTGSTISDRIKISDELQIERIKYYGDPDIIPSDENYFTVNETGETITGLTSAGKTQTELVIPYKINGIEITAIGDDAFSETPLTNVVIPNSVTSIGYSAFYYCALTNISIPNSVTSIGNSAFSYCALTNISIPNGVTSIGASTFNYCESLKNVTIPNSVTSIGNSAFHQCTSLTSINIPNSVTSIGDDVFHIYDFETSSVIPIPGLTLYCEQGSYAETYAKANNISIMYTDISAATIDAKADKSTTLSGYGITDAYTKTEIDSKVSSVYRYKGTVENYTSLPTSGLTVGDVYNIENAIYPTVSTKYAMSVAFDNAYTTGSGSNLTYVYQYIIGEHYTHLGDSTEFYVYVQDKQSGLYEAASVSFTDVEVRDLTTEDPDGNVEVLGLNVTFKITDSSFEKYNDYAYYGELYIQEVGSETDSTKGTAIRVADDIMKARVKPGDNVAWTGSEWDILAGTVDLSNYAKKSTTLAGYGITNAYTKGEIDSKISNVYEIKGSSTIANLPANPEVGDVYNITDSGTITGTEIEVSVGDNIVYTSEGWDKLAATVDLSSYATETELERLKYYGDKDIVPSDESFFNVNETGETITGLTDTGKTQTELVIPYKINGVEITDLQANSTDGPPPSILDGNNVITKVVIPNSVNSIGDFAFEYCPLTSINIPNSVKYIGDLAFSGCPLTSIDIPNSVTSIGMDAFNGCTSLTSINIPNSVTSIRMNAFNGCTSLTSINIPNSVTSIDIGAFGGCTSLTSINIPNSVTYIGEDAFSGCTNLTIYCEQGSYAETYAKGKNIPIVYTDVKDITSSKVTTITVPTTGWTTSTDTNGTTYYSINITDSILTSTGYPITDVVLPSDIAAARLQSKAYQNVNKITVNDGSVDLYCFDSLPTVSFQIRIQLLYI